MAGMVGLSATLLGLVLLRTSKPNANSATEVSAENMAVSPPAGALANRAGPQNPAVLDVHRADAEPEPSLPQNQPPGPENGYGRYAWDAGFKAKLLPNNPGFQARPFAVVKESARHQWTAEDGRDPSVIARLAHNPMEEERLLKESEAVIRCQLVYCKESLRELGKRVAMDGEPVKSLTLPGFDGEEFVVEVTSTSFEQLGNEGSFAGHLRDDPDSFVNVAYVNDAEVFNIHRQGMPDVIGEPREPGQIVVKIRDLSLVKQPRKPEGQPIRPFDVGQPETAGK
jgi:hypothetical protein